MIVSQTETVAVLSGYFHFGNNHDLISFLLELFGFSELLTISKMEIVEQLLQNLQQLKNNRNFRFFKKNLSEFPTGCFSENHLMTGSVFTIVIILKMLHLLMKCI